MEGKYVTLEQVREEAGFTGNLYIADEIVLEYVLSAESEVRSFIGRRYKLPLEHIPAIVIEATKQLAAGFLLLKEYGVEEEGTTKDGQMKVKWARSILEKISRGQITLFDEDELELVRSRSIGAEGFPNASTGTDRSQHKDDPPQFEIGQKF